MSQMSQGQSSEVGSDLINHKLQTAASSAQAAHLSVDAAIRFNLSGEPRGRRPFSGRIRVLSLSAIGEIDGFVLEDGSFVQIPPYAWIDGLDLKVGDVVSGDGDIKLEKPHGVFAQATLFKSEILIADDNLLESQRLELIERHRHAKNALNQLLGDELSHQKLEEAEGTLMAIGLRAPAEVDRLILENGASVHIPPSMQVLLGDIEIGEYLNVQGRVITFTDGNYVLAQRITTESGETLR